MSHDPEDWCKIWRENDLLFQNWQEFSEIWPEHSKVSKICTFIGSYCAKYLMFDLKSTEELSFMTLKSDAKFEKNWLVIWKMTWEIWQIFTRALESVQIGTLIGCFCPKQRMYELKIYRGVVCHENEE